MVAATTTAAPELCAYAVPSGDRIACADLEAAEIKLRQEDIAWAPDSRSSSSPRGD